MENLVETFINEKLSIYNFAKKYKLEQDYEIKTLTLRHNHNNDDEQTMFFNTSLKKAVIFLNYIYNNSSIRLERKYNRFAHYISNNINAGSKIGGG